MDGWVMNGKMNGVINGCKDGCIDRWLNESVDIAGGLM
jgi:hypothetical protein